MSNSTWPAYQLLINSARTLAEHADVPRDNAGAALFAVAMEVLAKEWGTAKLSAWLRTQCRRDRFDRGATMKRKLQTLKPRVARAELSSVSQLSSRTSGDGRERKRFYDSAQWQKAREAKLRRDPACQWCRANGHIEQAVHVDHWQALAAGGDRTADSNLVSLCHSCHSRKTALEQAGKPLPQIVASEEVQFVLA